MSIKLRFWISGTIILLVVAVFVGVISWNIHASGLMADTVRLTVTARNEVQLLISDLKDAETGQRGYIITGSETYLAPYTAAVQSVPQRMKTLRDEFAGQPAMLRRLDTLDGIIHEKFAELDETISLRREQGFDAAEKIVATDRGRLIMDNMRVQFADILTSTEDLLTARRAVFAASRAQLQDMVEFGAPSIAMIIVFTTFVTIRGMQRQLKLLDRAFQRVGAGDLTHMVEIEGKGEVSRLASSFNNMAAQLLAEQTRRQAADADLKAINAELSKRTRQLETRTRTIDLLGRMADRLPGCTSEEEFTDIVECFAPQILSGVPGALYVLNNSRTVLRALAVWNDPLGYIPEFAPNDCWGMRRGQPHIIDNMRSDISCQHIRACNINGYQCLPLAAQGETVGMLYLEASPAMHESGEPEMRHASQILAENIALALVNMSLRENLRRQSIRDVLTGLFNRRYLDETVEVDFARAARVNDPVSIIMLDVDHFKRFNDEHGHEAGDAVLSEIGHLLSSHTRKGDIACRYGGEEFTVIMTGSTIEQAYNRAEAIRAAAHAVKIHYKAKTLEPITISFGIAAYPQHGSAPADVMRAADQALYAAKRAGRDRISVAETIVTIAGET